MVEISQLPQYSLKVKNTFLEAAIDYSSDDGDDLNFDHDPCARRQVSGPPPSTNTMECMSDDKVLEKIDYTNGAEPKVFEPFEPELEPDLRQPLSYAAMVRQVTEGNWSTWKARQWEPDVELDIGSKKTSISSRSWADMTDDIHDAEWKPREKLAIDLSGALGMPTETNFFPGANLDKMTVHAIAASALLGCNSDQQHPNVPAELDAKFKQGCRRKRGSLIDAAARRVQKDQRQIKWQTHQNLGVQNMATNQPVPMFCSQCGGHCPQQYNFCRFCGAAARFNS